MGDLIGSAAVIVAAIVIVTTGWVQADAIASLLIAAMIIPRAISLLREVVSVLSESTPKGMHVTEIRDHILDDPGGRGLSRRARVAAHPRSAGVHRARRRRRRRRSPTARPARSCSGCSRA